MKPRVKYGILLISGVIVYVFIQYYMITNSKTTNSQTAGSGDFSRNVDVAVNTDDMAIPEDSVLKQKSKTGLFRLYERYTSSRQIMCRNMQRTGSIYDGGKDVCVDDLVKPKKPCIVYSFGSQNKFDFESDVLTLYGCEVYTFDPSMGDAKIKNPPGSSFYSIGISGKNEVTETGWRLRTLSNITNMLKHEHKTIDVLKLDVEHFEWTAIPDMINSGSIKTVKQLLVEFHLNTTGVLHMSEQLAVFRVLYNAGFRIFNSERNTYCKCHKKLDGRKVATLVEIAFINTMFTGK